VREGGERGRGGNRKGEEGRITERERGEERRRRWGKTRDRRSVNSH